MKKLPLDFYLQKDVVDISRQLLGKFLVTNIDNQGITSGMIVETEAYGGAVDRASHAFGNRQTERTRVMYETGGIAYIYLIYGFYNMFNVITNQKGVPHAILVRAVEPVEGTVLMLHRRKMEKAERRLTAGPGLLCQALGITRLQNGESLLGDVVWIEDRGVKLPQHSIVASTRVGVDYAGPDALLPWRFRIKDNNWTSKAK